MKMAKCDMCGAIKPANELSVIKFIPTQADAYAPQFKPLIRLKKNTDDSEYENISITHEFDVCDVCSAKILIGLMHREVYPSFATMEEGNV